jgi:uncharacterized protein (DUF1778 family)
MPKPRKPKKIGHRAPRDRVAANERVTLRLSPREAELLQSAAERAGVSLGAWIRHAAIEAAKGGRS